MIRSNFQTGARLQLPSPHHHFTETTSELCCGGRAAVNIAGAFLRRHLGRLSVGAGITKWFLYRSRDKRRAQPSSPDSGLRQHSSLPWQSCRQYGHYLQPCGALPPRTATHSGMLMLLMKALPYGENIKNVAGGARSGRCPSLLRRDVSRYSELMRRYRSLPELTGLVSLCGDHLRFFFFFL